MAHKVISIRRKLILMIMTMAFLAMFLDRGIFFVSELLALYRAGGRFFFGD